MIHITREIKTSFIYHKVWRNLFVYKAAERGTYVHFASRGVAKPCPCQIWLGMMMAALPWQCRQGTYMILPVFVCYSSLYRTLHELELNRKERLPNCYEVI